MHSTHSNGYYENPPISKKIESKMYEYDCIEKLNWLMHMEHVRGNIASCKELIKNQIEKSKGRNEYAIFKLGTIAKDDGRLQEALESFQACLKLDQNNSDYVKATARCLYEMKRFRLALEAYLEAERCAKIPDWQIYYDIGQCLIKLGDTAKAKDYVQLAVKSGKNEESYKLLVRILVTEGEIGNASNVCDAAISACPDSVEMLTESGLLYLKMGKTQYAFERLSSALALEPNHSKALLALGSITQSHEEYDVALTKYKLAVANDPDNIALWNNIGICFYSKQKLVAAISCLKRALWISPLNWKLLYNLGLVHLATNQPASAFNFLCAAVNIRADIPDSFMALGCDLLDLKDPENALRAFKQALHLSPENLTVLINMVLTLTVIKNDQEAYQIWLKFKEIIDKNCNVEENVLLLSQNLSTDLINKYENKESNLDGDLV